MRSSVVLVIGVRLAQAFIAPSHGLRPTLAAPCLPKPGVDSAVNLRPGKPDDEGTIRSTMISMLMNPLFIDVQNFVCAEDQGELVGFGQVRPR